jgi:hypothetical protein
MTAKDQEQPTAATGIEDGELEQGFLARWSQRKWETETLAPPHAELLDSPSAAEVEAAEITEPELTDADMPPVESLGEGSDYRGFLSPKVSEALRKAALRKLFSQSRFNKVDGLDDYAEDFTRFEPLGDLVTHEMRRMLERARKALQEGDDQDANAPPRSAGMGAGASTNLAAEASEPVSAQSDLPADRDEMS